MRQLYVLKTHKCLEVEGTVVGVSVRGDGAIRAVVLVDVYLPIEAWSGCWSFPRSGAVAASLFRHLSCNWEERKSVLASNASDKKNICEDVECIWNHPDCHVLRCKIHCIESGFSDKKLFDLYEVFKSLPGLGKVERTNSTRISPDDTSTGHGIWDVTDDILTNILAALAPKDLVRVSATCHHLRFLASLAMPCMKLKLFPHQQAAVEWMLKREHNAEILAHPLYMDFSTEDGFTFYINVISGEILTGMAPTIRDFRGGMFCDEPGLGKTVTTLSLILKTHGTIAEPPPGVEVVWCTLNSDRKCGYYELSSNGSNTFKRLTGRCWQISPGKSLPEFGSSINSTKQASAGISEWHMETEDFSHDTPGVVSPSGPYNSPATRFIRCRNNLSGVKRNLFSTCEKNSGQVSRKRTKRNSMNKRRNSDAPSFRASGKHTNVFSNFFNNWKKPTGATASDSLSNETWVQCDACRKWRKLSEACSPDSKAAWFCNMNSDTLHNNCSVPEESWDCRQTITHFPGFCPKGTPQGKEENISFFTSVLKEHFTSITSETRKALSWLARLSDNKLVEMETVGLTCPLVDLNTAFGEDGYVKIFQAFGLVRKIGRTTNRWYYPHILDNMVLDVSALQIALTKPLNLFRLYLSRATLIIVPANLVDHWRTQILKHVKPGQLHVFIWTDNKKPCAHNLAWDYDIVITTFNRLSAEWGPRKRSVLMQIHWLRVVLDEGHTLGSSLCLTNKLQMAISLAATNRWILTGTPTPNTPNSQVSHLQPMLKFLHEEAYAQNQKSWEAGILRPFEAEMEEGRSRLLQLLQRTMISARKADLHTIPSCIKKMTFLQFNEEHARSYNELVVTVRRNILMADWNDPSHVESLLNPKQWKFRGNTIRNVRLSCCVAGHIKVTEAGHDVQETMDILVEQGLDPVSEEYVFIKNALLDGCDCFRCKEWCRLPVITPCRHLLCLGCIALDSERCVFPGCGFLYEMQSPESLARPENPNPKWPVPKDLIELQPSYEQNDWNPDWHATSSSKVAYLVKKLKTLWEVNRKMGYCFEESGDAKPSNEEVTHEVTLPGSGIKIHDQSSKMRPEKVIIFSQFLEHIHVIEQQLTGAGIKYVGMYSPMHSNKKMKSLMTFQYDDNCIALLMDGSAALGLDLSFVGHVFLMEPIWDRSMEEQVISRAHRMGATRPIHVETLAMHGTIEEQMLEFLQDTNECRRVLKSEMSRSDHEGVRTHRTLHDFAESNYLAQLGFVRTNVKN
ncbi:F-box protein [Acorus calamus]|uniref:F-box protein n=1 Tax=Acorus calamus TaxID=4465 RepID=A0AAV9CUJ2_ACOCL|nr:F-box protein [Acorus calamus]